ncbi:TolC Outer membrane protein [Spirosomataceae bacterium]|jgi:outer membrane protein
MKKYLVIILVFLEIQIKAQNVLKLEEAQSIALEKNWGIKVTEKQIEAVDNQIFRGNAGMTPTLDWNASFFNVFNQLNQRFFDGREIDRFGVSITPVTNLSLSWVLYDGRRMNAIMERLITNGQQSRVQSQFVIQNTLSNVMQVYYDIQRLQQSREFLKIIIKYYEERLKITEERWQIGRGSKLDFLQSKTDISTQLADLTNLENQLKTTKTRLNGLLGREPNIDFQVSENTNMDSNYNLEELLKETKTKNQEFLLLKKSEEINISNQKEAQSFLLPRITLNSSLGYSFNRNTAGLFALNQSVGLNSGITATWRIFDGHFNKRNVELTKINGEIIKLQKEDLITRIENELNTSFFQHETDKQLLKLEIENKALAVENLEISLEKFKLGASTILELNDAQTRFNTAMSRLVNAQFNVKISELNLLRISGQLVK